MTVLDRTALACSVAQPTLKDALTTILRTVSGTRNTPILNNVRLTVTPDTLELAATDLETAYVVCLPIIGGESGSFTVPARLLADFVSTLGNGPVSLRMDKGVLKVESGRAKAKANVKGIEADEFPLMPTADGEPTAEIDRDVLRTALGLTVFATDDSGQRPVLGGVHMADGVSFVVEAADAYRLSRYASYGEADTAKWDVIVPAVGARELLKLCDADYQHIPLWLLPNAQSPAHLVARVGNDASTTFAVRLLAGQFPDLQRIIPASMETTVTASRQTLLSAVKQCTLFSSGEKKGYRLVNVSISGDGDLGLLELTAAEAQTGEGAAELSVTVDGPSVTIMLNGPYLIEVLTAMEGDTVVLGVNGPLSPATLGDPVVPDYTHILMPMSRS